MERLDVAEAGGAAWRQRKGPRGWSIHTKFAIATTVVFATMIGAGVLGVMAMQARQLRRSQVERLELLSSSFAGGLLRAMLHNGLSDLRRMLAAYGEHQSDAGAEVVGRDLTVVASTQPDRIGSRAWVEVPHDFEGPYHTELRVGQRRAMLRVEPLFSHGVCSSCHGESSEPIGYLMVSVGEEQTQAKLVALRNDLVLTSGLTLLLILLTSWFAVRRLVTRPVRVLAATMARAEAGDLGVRNPVSERPDELGWLAVKLNAMFERLADARERLDATYRDHMARADRFATVGELASGLAHEIKNPLAGLSGALELLDEDPLDAEERHEVIEQMQRSVARLDRTMNDLLRFARPSPASFAPTTVAVALEHVLTLIAPHPGAGGLEIVRHFDCEGAVLADASQLEQVFLNLCLNALQAMPNGGRLEVSCRDVERDVVVEIRDSGPGIEPADRPHVFRPFYTTKTTGTGLGLPICARIVAEHGGDIDFDCPSTGGCRFVVMLPRRSSDAAKTHGPSSDAGGTR